jgi:hypothetical protein
MVVIDQYIAEVYLIQRLVSLKFGITAPIHVFPLCGYLSASK